jgi:hypothetical protein
MRMTVWVAGWLQAAGGCLGIEGMARWGIRD